MKKFSYTVMLAGLFFAGAFQLTHAGWSSPYGGGDDDWGYCGYETPNGSYLFLGQTRSFGQGENDMLIIKTDADGKAERIDTYGCSLDDWTACMKPTFDGGFAFAGHFHVFSDTAGYPNLYLFKLGPDGDSMWATSIYRDGPDVAHHLTQTSDGGYIIAAEGDRSLWLIKTDKDANVEWELFYGDSTNRYVGYSVCEAHDGGYVVTGTSWANGLNDLWILMVTEEGDTVWTRTFGGEHLDDGYCIQQTSDGYYIITGWSVALDETGGNLWLLKVMERTYGEYKMGDTLWTRTYGGENSEAGEWVEETSDGGFIVGGWTKSFGEGEADFWLLKTNSEGDTSWTATHGGPDKDRCECVQPTSDGGYLLTGYTSSFGSGGTDMWVVKTDSLGSIAVAENPIAGSSTDWLLITSIGQKIALSYTDRPNGFHAQVFDATGRIVDEINAPGPSGTLTWGECCGRYGRYGCYGCYGSGVYFIRDLFSNQPVTRKVVLVD